MPPQKRRTNSCKLARNVSQSCIFPEFVSDINRQSGRARQGHSSSVEYTLPQLTEKASLTNGHTNEHSDGVASALEPCRPGTTKFIPGACALNFLNAVGTTDPMGADPSNSRPDWSSTIPQCDFTERGSSLIEWRTLSASILCPSTLTPGAGWVGFVFCFRPKNDTWPVERASTSLQKITVCCSNCILSWIQSLPKPDCSASRHNPNIAKRGHWTSRAYYLPVHYR